MSYSVSEFSKLLGISAETLRHYERKGLIQPRRDPNNKYRNYDFSDILPVLEICQKKCYGMSLSNISGIMHGMSLSDQMAWLHEKERDIDAQIKQLEKMKRFYNRLYGRIERTGQVYESQNNVEYQDLPEAYWLILAGLDENMPAHREYVVQEWVKALFYTHIMVFIKHPFAHEDHFANMSIGLGITKPLVGAAQLPMPPYLIKAPNGPGFRMTVRTSDPLLLKPSDLYPIRDAVYSNSGKEVLSLDGSLDNLVYYKDKTEYTFTFRTVANPAP